MKKEKSPIAARIAIAATITWQVLLIILVLIRPDLEPSWHTISEWALGPNGWLMTLAFIIYSIGYWATFVVVRKHVRGVAGKIGLGLLLICCVGSLGVGLFTMDPMTTPENQLTTRGILHIISGSSQLMLVPFAALLVNIGLSKNPEWASERKTMLVTAFVPLTGWLFFFVYTMIYVVPLGDHAYGPGVNVGYPPRVAFIAYTIWVIVINRTILKKFAHADFDRSVNNIQQTSI